MGDRGRNEEDAEETGKKKLVDGIGRGRFRASSFLSYRSFFNSTA
jgi:hypothetical protein